MNKYLNKEFLLENKTKVLRVAVIAGIVVAALFVFAFRTDAEDDMNFKEVESASSGEMKESTVIIVDVGGAVNNPAVVELKKGSRIGDAIDAAGGLKEDADISQINRAAVVSDGEKIYVPSRNQSGISGSSEVYGSDSSVSSMGKVNINSASSEELQTLSGVGPVTAEKIIAYRTSNGRFRSLEDIKNVSGIGDKTYEKLKPYIAI